MPSRTESKLLRSLRGRKGRGERGLFLAEGPHLLEELLRVRCRIRKVLHTPAVAKDAAVRRLLAAVDAAGIETEEVEERTLRSLADTRSPQGLLSVAEIPRTDWSDVAPARILVLDRVQDPGNVGTLIRTAAALGAAGVVCLPGTADVWSPKVVRATAGSCVRLPVLMAPWPEARRRLAAMDAALWVADAQGDPFSRAERAPDRLALVLGNEGEGVSDEIRRDAARIVAIRLARGTESLNVGAAGAILMDRVFGGGDAGVD